jgi:hypothetical protein
MSDAMMFLPTKGGYEVWRVNNSSYPIHVGFVSNENHQEEMKRQQALGYRVWVADKNRGEEE